MLATHDIISLRSPVRAATIEARAGTRYREKENWDGNIALGANVRRRCRDGGGDV